jgi:hypothetical protein
MAATFAFNRCHRLRSAVALLGLFSCGASEGAVRLVSLTHPPALSEDVDVAPKIAHPRNEAERRINSALALYDAQSRRELKQCRDDAAESNLGQSSFEWRRTIKPTMLGPHYLSFTIFTYGSCGGAHPWAQTASIILDLGAGARAKWNRLLPARLIGGIGADKAKGIEMPTLASKRLQALYVQAYLKGDHADDKQCREAVETADGGEARFQAWLDAESGGLAYVMLLNDFEKACMDEFVLPLETLREQGASATLLSAIAAAHAAEPAKTPVK